MLIDSHCHLNYEQLRDPLVLNNAFIEGVSYLQTICTKIEEFSDILGIANQCERIFCSIGVHPLNTSTFNIASAETIINLTKAKKVIGIGETGLDYYYELIEENREKQRQSFIAHIRAAQETGLPIIIHTREAENDTLKILQSEYERKRFTAVLHSFTGSEFLAEASLQMGFYISASGIITFKNAESVKRVFAKSIPLNKCLIETDSPYLAPVPFRGKTNQPQYLKYIAQQLAIIQDTTFEQVSLQTSNNFFNLFTKAKIL